jgi:hypothetical protein
VAPDSSFMKRETNLDILYLLLCEQFTGGLQAFGLLALNASPSSQVSLNCQ